MARCCSPQAPPACQLAAQCSLTNGARSESSLLSALGPNSNAEALARELGPGWVGGTPDLALDDAFHALNGTGSWAARVSGTSGAHMVVVDGLSDAGCVLIRDPGSGSSYETPFRDFLGAWRGQAVWRG